MNLVTQKFQLLAGFSTILTSTIAGFYLYLKVDQLKAKIQIKFLSLIFQFSYQTAIFEPVDKGKRYIPQNKALNSDE